MSILLGTDPELVCVNPDPALLAERGLPVTEGALPAYYVMDLKDPEDHHRKLPFGMLTPDGVALEFTVDPTSSPIEMVQRLRDNIKATNDFVQKVGGVLSVNPRVYVDRKYIDLLPANYGKACSLQLLGCDPDTCCYGWDLPKKPNPKTHTWRTTGGHIHFGLGREFVENTALVAYFVALCDATLGAATTILCNSEEALLRKEQYGQPGMHRTDSSRGTLEYRTMPAQAFQTPELAELLFTKAAELGNWAHDLFVNVGQAAAIKELSSRIGGLDTAFKLAEHIRDHDAKGCMRYMQVDFMADVLSYKMPEDFFLHGWL